MIDWNKYQQEALTTAVFPLERSVDYTTLGLISEVAELVETYWWTKCPDPWNIDGYAQFLANCRKELGDCFWYAAALADALGTPLAVIGASTRTEDEEYRSTGDMLSLLTARSGAIAGHVKKAIRDDDGHITDTRKRAILNELQRLVQLMFDVAYDLEGTPEGIMQDNLNKLADRKRRGVLQGSGDNR